MKSSFQFHSGPMNYFNSKVSWQCCIVCYASSVRLSERQRNTCIEYVSHAFRGMLDTVTLYRLIYFRFISFVLDDDTLPLCLYDWTLVDLCLHHTFQLSSVCSRDRYTANFFCDNNEISFWIFFFCIKLALYCIAYENILPELKTKSRLKFCFENTHTHNAYKRRCVTFEHMVLSRCEPIFNTLILMTGNTYPVPQF